MKKWVEKRKDLSVQGPEHQNSYNNHSLNKTIASSGQTFGYLLFLLILSNISILNFVWSVMEAFELREISILFFNDILLPVLYYWRNPDLSRFVKESISLVILDCQQYF